MQLTIDGSSPFINAVDHAFGVNVGYAKQIKTYPGVEGRDTRYSPSQIVSAPLIPVTGNPKPHLFSMSHIERQNLAIRMQLKRFARLTLGYSQKLANLKAALSQHFAWYNFCRIHHTLRVTPAMAAGICDHVYDLGELVGAF